MRSTIILCFFVAVVASITTLALSEAWLDQPLLATPKTANPQTIAVQPEVTGQFEAPRTRPNNARPNLGRNDAFGRNDAIADGRDVRRFSAEERTNIGVYEKVKSSVVNIDTKTFVNVRWLGTREQEGSGSGWILDKAGHIVTNYHVVQDSDLVSVTINEGESVPAEVIGVNPRNDIAVLKVNVDPAMLTPVELGESDTLRVGQKIFAIGNPFGLNRTMTVGIISSLDRTLDSRSGQQIRNVIQIDAALNQGNSGGPLLDSDGLLVGMNTAIATLNGGNSGVGFAVPARTIRRVVPQLIEFGKFRSPWLGVDFFWKAEDGIGVAKVAPGGPADDAGLLGLKAERQVMVLGNQRVLVPKWIKESADVIVKVDDTPISELDDLQIAIEEKNPGDRVELTIRRDGRQIQVPIVLGEER